MDFELNDREDVWIIRKKMPICVDRKPLIYEIFADFVNKTTFDTSRELLINSAFSVINITCLMFF